MGQRQAADWRDERISTVHNSKGGIEGCTELGVTY